MIELLCKETDFSKTLKLADFYLMCDISHLKFFYFNISYI